MIFLESRLKGQAHVTHHSETRCSSKKPSTLALQKSHCQQLGPAAEQAPSLVPRGWCKLKPHHTHSTWCIFVSGAGSCIAICGCEQQWRLQNQHFRRHQSKVKRDARRQMLSSVVLGSFIDFNSFTLRSNDHPSGLAHIAKYQVFPNPTPRQPLSNSSEIYHWHILITSYANWPTHSNSFPCCTHGKRQV